MIDFKFGYYSREKKKVDENKINRYSFKENRQIRDEPEVD